MTMQQNLLHKFIFMEDYTEKAEKVDRESRRHKKERVASLHGVAGGEGLAVLHGVLCVVALNHQRQVLADLGELVSIQQLDEVV